MRVVAVASMKGGVGKTTTAVNLAYEAGRSGVRVLVWDLDPQAGATHVLRARPRVKGGAKRLAASKEALRRHIRETDLTGVHVAAADLSLRHLDVLLRPGRRALGRLLDPVRQSYDLAILDCAPGLSRAVEAAIAAADVVVVPVVPSPSALRALDQLAAIVGDGAKPRVAPLLTMVQRRRADHLAVVQTIVDSWPATFATLVPSSSVVDRIEVERAPLAALAGKTQAAGAFREVWHELEARLWANGS